MFKPVENNVSFPKLEEAILDFWKENEIYERSLSQRSDAENFVFYEGPPTANGKPHPGHCLTRAMKDLFPRYKTMRGFRCERRAGWDTHGLPVEVEVCKGLGIHSKEEIEAYGVEPFIQLCQKSVWQYMQQWERLTERIGFWIHLDRAYVTYHQSYVESVWWSLKNLFDRGLLYQGHKIVWWWAQGGTALSSGEVGQGYKSVGDPSVFVLFPLLDRPNTSLLVWTTTPWTLPSNQFAAVHTEIEYATVHDDELNQDIIMAADLVETIGKKVKRELTVRSTCKGSELVGLRYQPPFDFFYRDMGEQTGELMEGGRQHLAWRITSADFVTTDSGTGAVHEAPAFGEVDYELLMSEQKRFVEGQGPEMICAVDPNGKLTSVAGEFAGLWVKDADKPIIRALKESGRLYHQELYQHDYPFCWRAENDPLIQYPRRSWFIKTTEFKDEFLRNNSQVNWLPGHIRDGRFGNFLESNVDWALSRERYWGTPLPVWVCEETGFMEAIGNYAELEAKPGVSGFEAWKDAKQANPELPEDLKIHKPYIDNVTYQSPKAPNARMRRVTEVIDCWYDSGAMPFAQSGYPHQNKSEFENQFPANFISEALDQTRGWFYSLLAISTMMFGRENDGNEKPRSYPHPFENCIVLGLMLAESYVCTSCGKRHLNEVKACEECGKKVERRTEKMSKQLRNYREPQEIFDRYGADALRWYFYSAQPPWNSIVYSERAIKESIPEFLLRLWNTYSFFVLYANMDGFDPAAEMTDEVGDLDFRSAFSKCQSFRAVQQRSELDRWVLSELNLLIRDVASKMDAYDNYGATNRILEFLDGLSNWFVRRSRDRFWSSDKNAPDKLDAYWTLYECLVTLTKLIAPFVPFVSESLWQNLVGVFGEHAKASVHLANYPEIQNDIIDEALSKQMDLLREIASLGRAARMEAKLKVRQPLSGVTVVLNSDEHAAWLKSHGSILLEELNVKSITYETKADEYVSYEIQPNFKRLGPRVGKLLPQLKKHLAECSGADILNQLSAKNQFVANCGGEEIVLEPDDIQIRLQAKEGWAAAQGPQCVVVLATELSEELILEGIGRDVIRLIQDYRKQRDLDFSDRIALSLFTQSDEIKRAVETMRDTICSETLTLSLNWEQIQSPDKTTHELDQGVLEIYLKKSDEPK
ncbi:MAG: isoleucine--tRNA ligase [Pirellulaceae bacterium]